MTATFANLLDMDTTGKAAGARQVADRLRSAMAGGQLAPGERLPTIRQLSLETGLRYNVINRAIGMLQDEGLLICRKRGGTFVTGRVESMNEASTKVKVFALIGPELNRGFYPTLLKGMDLASGKLGYQVIASNTEGDVGVQADTIMQLMDKNVSGVALVPATFGAPPVHQIRLLQKQGIAVVLLHRGIEQVQAPRIVIRAEEVGREAGRRMVEQGHVRIAYCASQRAGSSEGYERGLRQVMSEHGLELGDRVHYGELKQFNRQEYAGYEGALSQWFDKAMEAGTGPTAIFTSFESIGEIVYLQAMRRGLRVPEELSIVTVGGIERSGAVSRRLSCVTLDEQRAGAQTAQLLDEMCSGRRQIVSDPAFDIPVGFDPAGTLGRYHPADAHRPR